MGALTLPYMAATITALLPHVAVWFDSHIKHKMPIARLPDRLRFQMQQIYSGGRILGSFGSHGSCAVSVNPTYVHRQIFDRIKRCPQSSQEVNTMSQDKSALSTTAQTEQEITVLETLHTQFQQLCFAYGSLAVTTFNTEKFKWLAQDAIALADVSMAIHRQNGGL